MFKHPPGDVLRQLRERLFRHRERLLRLRRAPLENSTAGSVKQIYDLMLRHSSFKIVRSTRLKVDHNLVAKKGTKLEDIKEIFSPPPGHQPVHRLPGEAGQGREGYPLREHRGRRGRRGPVRTAPTWPPSPPTAALSSTAWSGWPQTSRTGATTTPGSSASPRSWRSIPGRTRPPSWWSCPTGPAPCTRSWPGSMPWA